MKHHILLLCSMLSISTSFAALQCHIERTPVEAVKTESGWKLERDYDLAKAGETAAKELPIAERLFTHDQHPHISGAKGDIVIRLSLPGPAATLKAAATISNFSDSATRTYAIAYSFDGIRYTTLAEGQASGACELAAEQQLPKNHGVIYLKYGRLLAEDDANGRHGYVLWGKLSFAVTGADEMENSTQLPYSQSLKDVFPTGVFWPWERTPPCADYAKKDLWEFVDSQMQMLSDNGYDTLWFVNIGTSDMQRILPMAEAHKLRVLFNTDLLHAVYNGADSLDTLESLAWNTFKNIGGASSLLGYIGKDEPLLCDIENMSTFYRLMKQVDPSRDLTVVTMNRQTLTYLRDTPMPVACSDLYYFGSARTIQLPQPHESQPELTNALESFCLAARLYGKHFWFMGQMFGEAWGRHWRRGDKLVVEPGTYLHWKMPTDAESRWQIWEALRAGAKGMLFYVLYPPIQLEVPPAKVTEEWQKSRVRDMDSQAETAASWKTQPLVEAEIEIDAGEGMTDMDGSPTPQMLATAPVMKLIRKHEKLLLDRDFASVPLFFPGDEATDVNTFESQGRAIGVIVNRDLLNSRNASILLPQNVESIVNLETGEVLSTTVRDDVFRQLSIPLPAGGGALLEAKSNGRTGICLCKEDFGRETILRVAIGDNAVVKRHGNYGVDFRHVLRLKENVADRQTPVCILPRLTSAQGGSRTVAMNLNRDRKDGTLFCWLKGNLTTCRTIAVSEDTKGENDNFAHLKSTGAYAVAPSGKGLVIQDGAFTHPVSVPYGTASLELYLESPEDYISEIRLWFVP